jgi:serine/threonine protein kinase
MADRVGQQLGAYRLVRLLGRGGFAEVYLGEHIDRGTQVAIKVLHAQLTSKDIERFNAEASTIARLTHPHIVRLLEFATDEGTPFLVLDYAPGGTLRERHPRGTPLPVETILPYVRQACDALQYAHEQKLIHRDVKPENLLLSADGQVLLGDFGIATVAQSSHSQSTQEALGTVAYMAPEQIQGKPRPASDVYALGIIVYEWLTGDPPFSGSFGEIATQHLFSPPPPLRERVPTLSEAVESVVLIALAKDPKQRFTNPNAFAAVLEEAAHGQESLLFAPTQVSQPTLASTPPVPETLDSPSASASSPANWQHDTGSTAPELLTSSLPAVPAATPTQPANLVGLQTRRRPVRKVLMVVLALLLLSTSGVALALSHPSLFGGASPQTGTQGRTAFADSSPTAQGRGSTPTRTATSSTPGGGAPAPNPTNGPAQKPTPTNTATTPGQTPAANPTLTPTPTSQPTPTPTPQPPPPPTCCPGTAPSGSYGKWWVDTFAAAPGYYGAGSNWHQVGTLYAATNYVFCKAWGPEVSDGSGNYNHWWLWTDLDTGGQGWVSAYYLTRWGNDVAKDNSGNVIPTCSA